jgi:malonyl-CoA decarboxylase
MANEPLIFVEVALVNGMADNIQTLLDESAPACDTNDADTAIFYSISNAQVGLTGISFGNFLIKRVVDDLAQEFKGLKTFATLSPLSGFRSWLDAEIAANTGDLVTPAEAKSFAKGARADAIDAGLLALLDTPWHIDSHTAQLLKRPMMRLCARYLLHGKRNGLPWDRVARFHLSNGARIDRINWLADTSPKGLQQSAGMMINYVYKLDEIEENHEVYSGEGRIAAAATIKSLLS